MLTVDIDIENRVSEEVNQLIELLDSREDLNQVGAIGARNAAQEYHRDFQEAGGWRGNNTLNGPGRESGKFGQNVALGWHIDDVTSESVTVSNNADFFKFKTTGGKIIPKRAEELTIPMVSEAAGRRVKDYIAATGNILFRITGKKALFEATEGGGIRAVYALVKELNQDPWPDAVPDDATIEDGFIKAWTGALADKLELG